MTFKGRSDFDIDGDIDEVMELFTNVEKDGGVEMVLDGEKDGEVEIILDGREEGGSDDLEMDEDDNDSI